MDLHGIEKRVYLAVIYFYDGRVKYCVFDSYDKVNRWYKDNYPSKNLDGIDHIGITSLYMNHDWRL